MLSTFPDFLVHSFSRILPIVMGSNIILYLIAICTNNMTYIDFGWAINHIFVASYYFYYHDGFTTSQGAIIYIYVLVWGLRLGSYILMERICKGYSDARYEELVNKYDSRYLHFIKLFHFVFQALLLVITSSNLYFTFFRIHEVGTDTWCFWLGSIICIGSLIGETIADYQLDSYKSKKRLKTQTELAIQPGTSTKKGIFRGGVWKYSRHPNLFFEFLFWFGISFLGIREDPITALGFLAPVFLSLAVNGLTVPNFLMLSTFPDFLVQSFSRILPIVMGSNIILYFIAICTNNMTYIDFGWAINHIFVASYYFYYHDGFTTLQGTIMYIYVLVWGFRLGNYILMERICKGYSDVRYEELVNKYDSRYLYFVKLFHFVFQALLLVITSSNIYFTFFRIHEVETDTWCFWLGSIICIGSLIGETIADYQLDSFKSKKRLNAQTELANPGTSIKKGIFRGGIWKYSRHPNLFFEFLFWFGISFLGIREDPITALGFFAPVFLSLIVNGLTVPLTEKGMKERRGNEEWEEYLRETNKYFPFFKI